MDLECSVLQVLFLSDCENAMNRWFGMGVLYPNGIHGNTDDCKDKIEKSASWNSNANI